MNHKRLILDRLLDRYEKSKSFKEANSRRRIFLKMGTSDFAEYDIEKPLIRETFNSVVEDLAEKELVGFEWLKHERGNIIERVWLNVANAEQCYFEIGRKAKRSVLDRLLDRVIELKTNADGHWMAAFLSETEQSIRDRASIAGFLPADEEQALAVLEALDAVLKLNDAQCLERVFSLRCYNDSKYFEKKVKSRLAGIVKRYCIDAELSDEMSDDDALMEIGILQAPERIEFRGGIRGEIGGREIDFSIFSRGISLDTDTIKDLSIGDMGVIRTILFIENKANYIDFLVNNQDNTWMTVFHGGFYSPSKGAFFKKIYEAASISGIEFYHWGDIDLGGFKMFKRLKTTIIPSLKPYLMDKGALESRIRYGMPMDSRYGDKIRKLSEDEQLKEFREVIALMLEKNVRLEQEAFLI